MDKNSATTPAPAPRSIRERVLGLLLASSACGLPCCGSAADLQGQGPAAERETIVGLPCENCHAVFEGLPSSLGARARIAPESEPGEPLSIEGTVLDARMAPVGGVIIYAYHTDARGLYPRNDAPGLSDEALRNGRLRAWVKSDAEGRYRFDTIRPAGYPNTDLPAHVHMHVLEVGRCTYYIDDVLFDDDPRLTAEMRRQMDLRRGGSGIATPVRDASGNWLVRRDIVLGENIPGYPPGAAK